MFVRLAGLSSEPSRLALIASTAALMMAAQPAAAQQAAPATAQDTAAPADAQAAPAEPVQTQTYEGEIVVTARKRTESLQSVPVSAAVVGGEAISTQGISTVQDLTRTLPSVQLSKGTTSNRQIIRGVGSGDNPSFEQSVGTFVDEIYHGRARSSEAGLFDVERVEVLKGPQTTYFGNNAIAGALNIVTRDPGTTFSGDARLQYTPRFGGVQGEVAADIPVTTGLSVRIAGQVTDTGGWIHDYGTDEDYPDTRSFGLRGTVLWKPTDNFTARAKVQHTEEKGRGGWPIVRGYCPPDSSFTIGAMCAAAIANGAAPYASFTERNTSAGQGNQLNTDDYILSLNQDMGAFALTSVTGYSKYSYNVQQDLDLTSQSLLNWEQPEKYQQFSQELRITSDTSGPIEYVGGLYYQSGKVEPTTRGTFIFLNSVISGTPALAALVPYLPLTVQNQYVERSDTYSGFGAITVKPAEGLRITGALRYSVVDKRFDRTISIGHGDTNWGDPKPIPTALQPLANGFATAAGLAVPGQAHLERSDHHLSRSASIEYKPDPALMLYARYDHGFKAGGFNGIDLTSPVSAISFNPETVDSFELGAKTRVFDNRGTFDVALFREKFSDLQLSSVVPTTSGAFVNRVQNAGGAISQGVEVEATMRFNSVLSSTLNLTYLDSHYTTYRNATPTSLETSQGITSQDLSGKRLSNAPRWTGSWGLDLTVPVSDQLTFRANNLLFYKGFHYIAPNNEAYMEQNAYFREDLTFSLESSDGWTLSVVGKNLTDHLIKSYAAAAAASLGSFVYITEPPRSIAFQVKVDF